MSLRHGLALALVSATVLASAPALAGGKERCKVEVGGDYRLIDRTFTKGGCELAAKKVVGPTLCGGGQKRYEFKYMFDGIIFSGSGMCSLVGR